MNLITYRRLFATRRNRWVNFCLICYPIEIFYEWYLWRSIWALNVRVFWTLFGIHIAFLLTFFFCGITNWASYAFLVDYIISLIEYNFLNTYSFYINITIIIARVIAIGAASDNATWAIATTLFWRTGLGKAIVRWRTGKKTKPRY